MHISAQFHGILSEWVTSETIDFELGPEPVYADLLGEIGRRFGKKMPPQLWNKDKGCFHPSVLALADDKSLAMDSPLEMGAEIAFYLMLAGG